MPQSNEYSDIIPSDSRIYNQDPARQARELVHAWHRAARIAHEGLEELDGMREVIRTFLAAQQKRFGPTASDSEWFQELARLIERKHRDQAR